MQPQPLIQDRAWTKYRLVAQQISSHHRNDSLRIVIVIVVAIRRVMRYSHNLVPAGDIMVIASTNEQITNKIKVAVKSASKSYT